MHTLFYFRRAAAALLLASGVAGIGVGAVAAQSDPPAGDSRIGDPHAQPPRCADPCIPARLRGQPATRPSSDMALQQQALAKLRQRFDEADADRNGAVTSGEARMAGFGYLVNHFADIDRSRTGAITFDDLRAYLAQRRMQARGPDAQ